MNNPKFQIIGTTGKTKNYMLQITIPKWTPEPFDTMEEAEAHLKANASCGLMYYIVPVWDYVKNKSNGYQH